MAKENTDIQETEYRVNFGERCSMAELNFTHSMLRIATGHITQ